MKRVYCLYRVSTMGQVEKDDIPMQREACREFARSKGWTVCEEFSEKGVSGFKVSSENREALQSIKKAAIQKSFDILLVFMFDRLGRRDDETPFIVEWFVKNGIEVWSVNEGEQRFEDHVDKLLNYIRYWQASGESIKTSIRTKTRMEQMAREGLFTGGTVAYGYKLCKLGRMSKKGHEVHDILIEPEETRVVKEIFRLYCSGEMGTYRIASYLTGQGIPNKNNKSWNSGTVLNMIKNVTYTGVLKVRNGTSNSFSHLRIIDDETFAEAAKRVDENKITRPRGPRSRYRASCLFADIVYCMHCGKRMTVTCNTRKRVNKRGDCKVYERMRYFCQNRKNCNGQHSYSVNKVDEALQAVIESALLSTSIESLNMDDDFSRLIREEISEQKSSLEREKQTLDDLKKEVINVIRGTSAFGSVLLNELIRQSETSIIKLEGKFAELQGLQKTRLIRKNRLLEIGKSLCSGGLNNFSALSLQLKQEIICEVVDRIYLGRDYQYRIEWGFGGVTQGQIGSSFV